ncbi:DUF4439 domain-containing protein [Streptomyces finlayi]|uniref:DUF4439 domain-containing protein n=2 Tax=Streptomyces finlayi TaxID=67296 RepID=A0A7G7BUW5_9ACTN|nr:DUF4439 domain-containing protein [Streptomyces finlayi]
MDTGAENRSGELKAAQAALAAEHAAVYGYAVLGGRLTGKPGTQATASYDGHRARRDALVRTVRDLGGAPVVADGAYALPFAVRDPAAAVRLAAVLEDRIGGVYSDLVRATRGTRRREAAGALREAAVRAARWRGTGVAFPGLPEKATASEAAGPAGPGGTH